MLLRSFMFLPAHNRRFIDSALRGDADAIILDLEDAVPPARRAEARRNIAEYSAAGRLEQKRVFIRVNPIGTADFVKDIDDLTLPGVDGFMPSKIRCGGDIVFLDGLLSFFETKKDMEQGGFLLAPLIETAGAVGDVDGIARASGRLVALCLGGEDYLNDLGSVCAYQPSALLHARAVLVNAARARGLLPIDTPYLDISDIGGFERRCAESFRSGFAGSLILNPGQIAPANRGYLPDAETKEHAERVLAAVEAANRSGAAGVAMLDGAMVGPPLAKRAEAVLRLLKQAEDAASGAADRRRERILKKYP